MAIRMRRGLESELDISKAVPGEWLVSTDTKYVRMCFAPGIVLRMATYEAFEEDMEQIKAILEESKTVEEAIQKIYNDVQKVVIDIETASNAAQTAIEKSKETENFAISASSSASAAKTSETNAKSSASSASTSASTATKKATEASTYAKNAKNSENTANTHATTASDKATEAINSALLAESYAVGGTGTRPNENTDNAKYYYEQTKNISPTGFAEGIALNRQTIGYSKKNLLKNIHTSSTLYGVEFTVLEDKTIVANGTAVTDIIRGVGTFIPTPNETYLFSANVTDLTPAQYWNSYCYIYNIDGASTWRSEEPGGDVYKFTPKTNQTIKCEIYIKSGTVLDNVIFKPMIRSADILDGTYEPYVEDVSTRLETIENDYLPISGGTIASKDLSPLTLERLNSTYGSWLGYKNSNGILGYVGMNGKPDEGFKRIHTNQADVFTILDTGNCINHNIFIGNRGDIPLADLDTFDSRKSGCYMIPNYFDGGSGLLTVLASHRGSASALEFINNYGMTDLKVRGGIDNKRYTSWKSIAFKENVIPKTAILNSQEEIEANTNSNMIAGALALKEIDRNINRDFYGTNGYSQAFDLIPNNDVTAPLSRLGSCYISNEEEVTTYHAPETGYAFAFGKNVTRYAIIFIGASKVWYRRYPIGWKEL